MKKLLLFDLDGTVLSGGPAKGAFGDALEEVFGTAGPIESWEFSGKTDPQIARELLSQAGLPDRSIDDGFPTLWERYLTELERRLPTRPTRLLPGLGSLMEALASEPVAVGLVTGNLARGAELKLAACGLGGRYSVGGFGSDAEDRNALPGIALERARLHWKVQFDTTQAVVIGDTPRDVECGKRQGMRTVAVATGNYSLEALERTGADVVLPDLARTREVLEILLE